MLADVEMGVTAELGRCRMTVRELLSITPGAVIDLDRAAGAPVDVLVNGTLIARGEVVVIDEEFGIRISELDPATGRGALAPAAIGPRSMPSLYPAPNEQTIEAFLAAARLRSRPTSRGCRRPSPNGNRPA